MIFGRTAAASWAKLANRPAALVRALPLLCAGFLVGCGASLDNGALISTGATEQRPEQAAGLGTAPSASTARISRAADAFASVSTPGSTAYRIGPLDVLELSVFKVPEPSRSVHAADTGTVNLPLVGEFDAAGKTARELEHDLTKELGAKYLQRPQVSVYVKEYNSH